MIKPDIPQYINVVTRAPRQHRHRCAPATIPNSSGSTGNNYAMAETLRKRQGRSTERAESRKEHRSARMPQEDAESVYSRALAAAFPCPFWAVAVLGCAPCWGWFGMSTASWAALTLVEIFLGPQTYPRLHPFSMRHFRRKSNCSPFSALRQSMQLFHFKGGAVLPADATKSFW